MRRRLPANLNEELSARIINVEQIESALQTYRDLYGIDSHKDLGQIILEESITQEGKQGLYETLIDHIRTIKSHNSWRQLAADIAAAEEAKIGADPDMLTDIEEALKIDQVSFKEISIRFHEMADEILAYYTHLKDNELVSDNDFALNRFIQLLFEPIQYH